MSITIRQGVTLSPGVSVKVPVYIPQQYTLTINVVGTGNGLVQGTPGNINVSRLPGTGSFTFDVGGYTILTASAAMGSVFTGWSGGGTSGTGSTSVYLYSDTTVTATFSSSAPTLVSITVTPTAVHLPTNIHKQMIATALFSDGSHEDYTRLVTWSSSSEAVAAIASNGLVTGVAPGTINIQAVYGPVSGSTVLVVNDTVLVALTITPSPLAVARDSTIQLTATGTFSDAGAVDITDQVLWSSSNELIATVDGNGLVTGHSGGSSTIQASLNGVQNSSTIFVGN